MARRWLAALGMAIGWPGWPGREALAGMPGPVLTDVARLRFEAISFFVAAFLAATWCVRGIWNGLRADFPRLPRLSFGRALGLVALWGGLFVLVLTMISGARELMTPGAWKKVGPTYKLAAAPPGPAAAAAEVEVEAEAEAARRAALGRLRSLLWGYAEAHDGRFPAGRAESGFPAEAWLVPDPAGLAYLYVPGLRVDAGPFAVAYEPGLFGRDRLVLLADGSIRRRDLPAIRDARPAGGGR